jgi:aryl-alcohol dehydrogenase-like predicted oxidoreductase
VGECGLSLPELALRFVLWDQRVHTTLMGARSPAEVEANVAAADRGPLSAELLERLQAIADMVPYRPFEEPFSLPFGRAYKGPGKA